MNASKIVEDSSYTNTLLLKKEFRNILQKGAINTVFQPIVNLINGEIIGYECLSRGPIQSSFHSPLSLIQMSELENRRWELEFLFLSNALQKAKKLINNQLLFLNVDPIFIQDPRCKDLFSKAFLRLMNIAPQSIVFEITERTEIQDYALFTETLAYYEQQGIQIAIDDTGTGFNSLKTILYIKPKFIKISMEFVRNIHKDVTKQSIMKAFVEFCNSSNTRMIAEGIETEEELKMLIQLGVYSGQGYYLQKPSEKIIPLCTTLQKQIHIFNRSNPNSTQHGIDHIFIGTIVEVIPSYSPQTLCGEIKKIFEVESIEGLCIDQNEYPVGLIMKDKLHAEFARQYGFSVYYNRPISLLMDSTPLIVDYYTSIQTVSELALRREANHIYDNIIVTKDESYYGMVSIKNLLQHSTSIEKNYARELNPLTSLPGNTIIRRVLTDTLTSTKNVCIFYADLDHFKIYNDVYGFENGDIIIKLTAEIFKHKIRSCLPYSNFLGHVGGDDFIGVIEGRISDCEQLFSTILQEFDDKILDYFTEDHRKKQYIDAEDRHGNLVRFPLTSLSIAALYGNLSKFNNPEQLAQHMGLIKKQAKKNLQSNYIIETIK